MAVTHLGTTELTSNTTTVAFTGIPGDGRDLMILYHAKSAASSGSWNNIIVRFNNSSSSNYNHLRMQQYYGSADSAWYTNRTWAGENLVPAISYYGENDVAGSGRIYVYNYAQSAPFPYLIESEASFAANVQNQTGSQRAVTQGYYNASLSVTSVYLTLDSSQQWQTGSTFGIYKLS